MTINFPARRSGTHFQGLQDARKAMITRRSLLKLGAGSAAITAAGVYGFDKTFRGGAARSIVASTGTAPVKALTLVGTDGWVSMPDGAAPAGPIWPDDFAPTTGTGNHKKAYRNLYVFGFAPGGQFETPDRLAWADTWNGAPGTSAEILGGLTALKNRANLSAPVLYYTEGDDVRLTMWNGGMGNRPDIVDAHTIHFHGFPNQIPYFDGVPNDSLSVPIGSNLVYRYLPYRGMAGTYMYHCHVSDAEHVQMGLQGIVFIRPYQNYGTQYGGGNAKPVGPNIPLTRGGWLDLKRVNPNLPDPVPTGPTSYLGYAFNDNLPPTDPNSTAYHREFAMILDDLDPRVHWDDSHFQEQDFSAYAPRFGVMNGRAWPDTIEGNWDVRVTDWTPDRINNFRSSAYSGKPFLYNIATADQVLANPQVLQDRSKPNPSAWNLAGTSGAPAYVTKAERLGSQPWSSLLQANAGETILVRFSNLGYWEHSLELAGLPFKVIGEDAKNLLAGRDGYEEDPNPTTNSPAISPLTTPRADISFTTYRTAVGAAESRDILIKIPAGAHTGSATQPLVFEFFDRNELVTKNAQNGGQVVGGMRTQLHVYPPGTLPDQYYPQQIFQPGA